MKYSPAQPGQFVPWQPSTWPAPPNVWTAEFGADVATIIETTVVAELENVIKDVINSHGSLLHRGHVIALSMLCSVDMVSSYAYRNAAIATCQACGRGDAVGPRYRRFIERHFPPAYHAFAADLYANYRNSTVHSWHLFKVRVLPDATPIAMTGGSLEFGLLDFFAALSHGVSDFLSKLQADPQLKANVLTRYTELRATAIP